MALSAAAFVGALVAGFAFNHRGKVGCPRSVPVVDVDASLIPNITTLPAGVVVDVSAHVTVLFKDAVYGAETVALDSQGRLYIPDVHGRIFRSSTAGGGKLIEVAYTGGRPLGCMLDHSDNLIVAVAGQGTGLLEVGSEVGSQPTLLAARVSPQSKLEAGSPIVFADGVDIAADGTIFWTDATDIPPIMPAHPGEPLDSHTPYYMGLLAGRRTGRLLKYEPLTGETHLLAGDLWFANGVALAADESFLLLAETNAFRILKYWLKGPKAGKLEKLADVAGAPDGLARASDGNFWVALPGAPRQRWVPAVLARFRFLRVIGGLLFGNLPPRWGMAMFSNAISFQSYILKMSGKDGSVMIALTDPTGNSFRAATSAVEHAGKLYLGSLDQAGVPVIDLRAAGLLS